jgi:hypothetical protein
MKLYIPTVGDSIRLTADWTVQLHNEERNETLMRLFNDTRDFESRWAKPPVPSSTVPVVIPAGEILKVDRIYIRKGQGEFDSITFLWVGKATPARTEFVPGLDWGNGRKDPDRTVKIPKKPVRFWVKLDNANEIEFQPA